MIGNEFVLSSERDYNPRPQENPKQSLFSQYEKVIVYSLLTSFGLDCLIKDQYGGDVDTVHNVRMIGKDKNMYYKNQKNKEIYDSLPEYDSRSYHSHPQYRAINRDIASQKKSGKLFDVYTMEKIGMNDKSDLDHVISAKEIHTDRGRVLSGLSGEDLANTAENLKATNPHTNRTKKADDMDTFLNKYEDEYSPEVKANMKAVDKRAREKYNEKINASYYSSPQFQKDLTSSALNLGIKMGVRQAIGMVFAEIWFCIKEEFRKIRGSFDIGSFLRAIGTSVKNGIANAKEKYKEILAKFKDGVVAGAIASISTTLINIFFSTAKNIVKIIRQTWVSLVEAIKILIFNPDNLPFGDKMRAVAKVIATGASIVIGTLVSEFVSDTGVGAIPIVGTIISTFCGTFVSGILSCTLLYFLDNSKTVQKIVDFLNRFTEYPREYYEQHMAIIDQHIAQILELDLDTYGREVAKFESDSQRVYAAKTEEELNTVLRDVYNKMNLDLPWGQGSFDNFMSDQNSTLIFN